MLAGMFMLASAAGAAEPPVRQVLILQSFNRGILVVDHFTGDLRVELDQRAAGKPANVVQVVVGPTGFVGASEQAVVDFIRSNYADRPPPDLIDHHRRPRRGIRAQVSGAAFSRYAAPVRVGR